mmetsp:Transcript_40369/g.104475  ORF Transcript_40369/g.104475 Transcript_40369/m.104475 type:complete len:163 (-) Transcript_40369:147-635(-)
MMAVVEEKVVLAASSVESFLDEKVAEAESGAKTAEAAAKTAEECAKKEGAEVVDATLGAAAAAAAALTGTMVVEFDAGSNGGIKMVSFKTPQVGLALVLSGGGCCTSGKPKVAVKAVDKKGQAETLGVLKSWKVVSINGTPVTGLDQAQKLLADCAAKIPQA